MRLIGRGFGGAALIAALSVSVMTAPAAAASTAVTQPPTGSWSEPFADARPAALPATAGSALSTDSVCGPAEPDHFRCLALRRTDIKALPATAVTPALVPSGLGPNDLASAYNLPGGSAGDGLTVAVVDAYDAPTAEADLAIYRAQYGLPPCTTANGCFHKVDQYGGSSYPAYDAGWAAEIALDLDMVSATCPNCHILLVEATDSYGSNLGAAVNRAVSLGAVAVSNSYGHAENNTDGAYYDTYYNHPGVAITVSTGDCGFNCGPYGSGLATNVQYPAASQYVIAVGGTSLVRDTSNPRGWTETAWGNLTKGWGAGSGCSLFQPKPSWQTDAGCSTRMQADVSAIGDPATGVAVYTSDDGGWRVYGGTSASAPIIASVYALAGTPAAGTYPASYLYSGRGFLNDVVGGSNDIWSSYDPCSTSYFCHGVPGYDGPTGLGTPAGLQAFTQGHAGLPGKPAIAGVAGNSTATLSWTAPSSGGATITGYTVTSVPAGWGCTTTTALSCTVSGLSNWTTYRFWVKASSSAGDGLLSDPSNPVTPGAPVAAATFMPLPPSRILDTRSNLGIAGALSSHVAQGFAVWGQGGVPAGATAVTGNLTVTQQTSLGFLYLGPAPANNPPSSTLNFPVGDDRANAVTVALSGDGRLYVTFAAPKYGPTAQVIFDVTGYFAPGMAGATYHPISPVRILDSRNGTGGPTTPLPSHSAGSFIVTGTAVPVGAVAVTGNLTVTQQQSLGFLYLGPVPANNPTSSTLNFPVGDDRANAVTVALGPGGLLSVTYAAPSLGPTAHVIFDVTGYFTADGAGAMYVPLPPSRILDSRQSAGGISILSSHVSQQFGVSGHGGVPNVAVAVTGNLTVTQQSSLGFLYVGPVVADNPTSSTLNFPMADDRANAVTVALSASGTLFVTYAAPRYGPTSHAIFDVSGCFIR
jgi:hypothetical protein